MAHDVPSLGPIGYGLVETADARNLSALSSACPPA
jgi:hypothetical protein